MQLRWSSASFDDRMAIFEYIAVENRLAAIANDTRIKAQARRLRLHPYTGRKGRLLDTRELVITGTPYITLYCVIEDAIRILPVLHGAQQWPRDISFEL